MWLSWTLVLCLGLIVCSTGRMMCVGTLCCVICTLTCGGVLWCAHMYGVGLSSTHCHLGESDRNTLKDLIAPRHADEYVCKYTCMLEWQDRTAWTLQGWTLSCLGAATDAPVNFPYMVTRYLVMHHICDWTVYAHTKLRIPLVQVCCLGTSNKWSYMYMF